MKIRRHRMSDSSQLEGLYRRFFFELRRGQGMKNPEVSKEEAREITRGSLKDSWVFVAEEQSRLIGFSRMQNWDGAYFVREVFVEEPYRRKGIASKLLIACERETKKKGESSVFLTVEPKHSISIDFLISNGYDTLNMLELRKDLLTEKAPEREDVIKILGHRFQLLRRG